MNKFHKQSVLHFLVAGMTLVVGAVNNLFLFSANLELKGLFEFIITSAYMIALFGGTGTSTVPLKYFPMVATKDKTNNGFLFFCIKRGLISSALIGILFLVLVSANTFLHISILEKLASYQFLILALIFCIVQVQILGKYLHIFQKVSYTTLINSFLHKVLTGVLFLLVIYDILEVGSALKGILVIFLLQIIFLIVYLYRVNPSDFGKINQHFFEGKVKNEIRKYAINGIFIGLSYVVVDRINLSMVAGLTDYRLNGIFAINSFIGSILLIPYTSLTALYSNIVSEGMMKEDTVKVFDKYKRSSDFLLVSGLFLFLLIWANLDVLGMLSPKILDVIEYRYIIALVAVGYLSSMLFGINDLIISYSKYYRFNVLTGLFLVVAAVCLNLLLIPKYGIYGAGISTAVSLVLFNLLKAAFIYWKFGMNVIKLNTMYILSIGIAAFALMEFMDFGNTMVGVLIGNAIAIIVFLFPTVAFGFSEIVTDIKKKYLG